MKETLQNWSLEDVLSTLFGGCEAKLIVQSMRGGNPDDTPENIFKNKDAKDKIVDGFIHLARNYYDETIAESYSVVGDFSQWAALELELNPLIIMRWLRDEGIFDELF